MWVTGVAFILSIQKYLDMGHGGYFFFYPMKTPWMWVKGGVLLLLYLVKLSESAEGWGWGIITISSETI